MDIPNLPSGGWLAWLALISWSIVRLLKAEKLNALLARLSIPPIPKPVLPWLAIIFGVLGGTIDAKLRGNDTWSQALLVGAWGMLAGGLAIAGHETIEPLLRAFLGPELTARLFGPKKPPVPPEPAS